MIKHIPNTLTVLNSVCGTLAIIQIFSEEYLFALYLIIFAALLDVFDGMLARMLNVSSSLGKDLDSLADMVTFGVLPGIMLYQYIEFVHGIPYIGLFYTACAIYRLAKFNNDSRQTVNFRGLPTPAGCLFFLVILYLLYQSIELNSELIYIVTFAIGLLMISDVELLSLKSISKSWLVWVIVFITSVVALIIYWPYTFVVAISTYIFLSIFMVKMNFIKQ